MSDDVAEMLERARKTLDKAMGALDAAQDRVIEQLNEAALNGEPYNDKLGSHLAWTAAKVSEILTSLRQLEKHDRQQSRSPEQRFKLVCDYIRNDTTPPQRAELARVLALVDTQQRVIS